MPVVGQDLLTLPESTGHKLLYPFLADRLAAYLKVSTDGLPQGAELNEVACRYLSKGKPWQQIYAALKTVAAETESLPVPVPLLQLAAIRPLQLFVSTTFDSFLTRALNQTRFGGNQKTRGFTHSPNEVQDLPGDFAGFGEPVVYQLMGKISATPAYAVTQEDLIEFFHSLQSETRRPAQLFHELGSRSLLVLGTRLSGWLTSFLMRMSKHQRLSADDKTDYVADDTVSNDGDLVLFLERFSSATQIFREADPIAFINELHQRWTESHSDTGRGDSQQSSAFALPHDLEPGAVFLSYASGDWSAVEKLKAALEEAGVDVFFDKDQLQPGNEWEGKLRRSIHQCSLFVPVISQQTLTPDRRFFRVEWNLALEEAQMASFSSEEAFLLPVVIDGTAIDHPALPAKFRTIQATSLPGGQPTTDFVDRIKLLYRKRQLTRLGTA
ncbi:toll/interleukin-1 receptor domain-containing protein [Tunturibacter psychrotolerans]|uniref:Toll/interleukin-1 receptor domain-containing protein n=1 Tax=Tunturiibacter psychrotolerans TaxID=3069686 RepID=A0AAU7ZPY0_9BACT